jgi:hypothetical protein
MPLGFFLSVTSTHAEKPSGRIALVYCGALLLAVSTGSDGHPAASGIVGWKGRMGDRAEPLRCQTDLHEH